MYNGIGSAVVGSAPGAALFFITYESVKAHLTPLIGNDARAATGVHMLAASLGELAACAVRVPTEVVKQRVQTKQFARSREALRGILDVRHTTWGWAGMLGELYRGGGITVLREVPFTVIQFPLWEGMKRWSVEVQRRKQVGERSNAVLGVSALESALYGSLSGAVAAGLTTPLDVLKTRLMLAQQRESVVSVTRGIWRNEGPKAFFAGLGPRTVWISIGGAVFLGTYQWAANVLGGGLS